MNTRRIADMHLLEKLKAGGIVLMVLGVACVAAWLTHIFTCLQNGEWGFLIAGALFFPIAIIHGFGLWLGFW
jgi:hypothetical protein